MYTEEAKEWKDDEENHQAKIDENHEEGKEEDYSFKDSDCDRDDEERETNHEEGETKAIIKGIEGETPKKAILCVEIG